ncbi:hypothetical protein [Streptomyces sp. NPDC002788]
MNPADHSTSLPVVLVIDMNRPVFARLFPHMSGAVDRGGVAEHRRALLAGLTGEVPVTVHNPACPHLAWPLTLTRT